uniref:Uncharacterized protein n=1 Tax=Candidatus Kentrum sp. FW TaxID=2126338 RepID=A0A450SZY2_9GAMM|nr:MAG: hypothetical protein BECKFW1821B_GA0114236_105024 [Candidatus Kentron sp. FW]
MYEIRHYITEDGKDTYLDWQLSIRDRKARIAIDRRVNRMERGNFGDRLFCAGMECGSCVSIPAPDIGSITRRLVSGSFCCCAVATSGHRRRISIVPANTGEIGREGEK